MKKYLLLTFIITCIGIILPYKAYSAEIAVGASTCETWIERNPKNDYNFIIGPTFIYGPVLSVKFTESFDITFMYLYGRFNETANYDKVEIRDSELIFNAGLNDYFKVFAGVKYMGFLESDTKYIGYGPELGLSVALPIAYKINLLLSVSGFFSGGEESDSSSKRSYNEYGVNGTLSLSYYIVPASTTVSLGRRFQYFKSDYHKGNDWIKNKFYGNTLTVTYSFDIFNCPQ
ncbi:MAG: hypothetical protein FWH53_01810 [Leptospirales bacterium]|nr:hypothetical protein [Leptospirales bacterium]